MSTNHHKMKHVPITVLPAETCGRFTGHVTFAPQCQNLALKIPSSHLHLPQTVKPHEETDATFHTHHPYLQDNKCWSCPSLFQTCPPVLGRKLPIQVSTPASVSALCFPKSWRHTCFSVCALGCWARGLFFCFVLLFFLEQIKQPVSNSQ